MSKAAQPLEINPFALASMWSAWLNILRHPSVRKTTGMLAQGISLSSPKCCLGQLCYALALDHQFDAGDDDVRFRVGDVWETSMLPTPLAQYMD